MSADEFEKLLGAALEDSPEAVVGEPGDGGGEELNAAPPSSFVAPANLDNEGREETDMEAQAQQIKPDMGNVQQALAKASELPMTEEGKAAIAMVKASLSLKGPPPERGPLPLNAASP